MARERLYNEYVPFDRPKLPRNKYGLINTSTLSVGTSMFGSSSSSGGNGGYSVGGEMAALDDFVGATRTEDGARGIVPTPKAGENLHFLQGSGGWVDIPAYRWFTEWPESEGLEKRGLSLNGDLNVTDTITTNNLEVLGAAHFFSLIIDEVKANGGSVLISPSMFYVDYVGGIVQYSIFDAQSPLFQVISNRGDIYEVLQKYDVQAVRCRRLYQRCDDGKMKIENECQIGDMLRCRSFNIKAGEYRNISNTDYWSFVCNTGEESYTDDDGNTYDAFFIDLAFTLRKSDGHNIPLGTKLYYDGRTPEYPNGYSEITDALELKRVSQETWNGSRDVENEYFENSEWTDIQEKIIKIRGLDDQVSEITGHNASDKLYDNERYITKTKESLDIALYGVETSTNSTNSTNGGRRSISPKTFTDVILTGVPDKDVAEEPTGNELRKAEDLVDSIEGGRQIVPINSKLIINRGEDNRIILPKEEITLIDDVDNPGSKIQEPVRTITDREFIVADDVWKFDPTVGRDVKVYEKDEIIPIGVVIKEDVPVIDRELVDIPIKEIENGPTEIITGQEKEEIDNFTVDTPTGVDRDAQSYGRPKREELDYWQFGHCGYYAQFRIKSGDNLACLGHLYDETRQNAIVLSSTNPIDEELLAPCISQYSHINLFGTTIARFRQTAIAANGNEFIGSFLVNYNDTYLDINEKIDLYINDMKSGLESCGIHLDGERSSISMVGSIDLKQHSNDSYDTLNMYDNLGVKRVEIKPFPVPERNSSESQIDSSKLTFTTSTSRKNATKNYIHYNKEHDSVWNFNGISNWYEYTLNNFTINTTTSVNLGVLNYGYVIDLSDLNLTLEAKTYLNGTRYISDHLLGQQKITTFTYTLKRNGVAVSGKNQVSITNYSYGGLNTERITLFSNRLFENYTITQSGTYTLDINVNAIICAHARLADTQYTNYYYTVNTSLGGTVLLDTTRVQEGVAHPTDMYKMSIGTNGMQFLNDNSRYFYAATDGMELRWDDSSISFDNDKGLYYRHAVRTISSSTALDAKYDMILCSNTGRSYTVTLPSTNNYGQGREITIFGFANLTSFLTVACASGNTIEIGVLGQQISVNSLDFRLQEGYPVVSISMVSIGNTWRVKSAN